MHPAARSAASFLRSAGAILALSLALATPGRTAPELSVGVSDEEFVGPLAGWLDARSDLGAVGDGVHDDTAAIQAGLDRLRRYDASAGPVVLYLPTGTYRITRGLDLRLKTGARLIGAGAASTAIVWDGPSDGTMLLTSGLFDALFARLTWDGRGRAHTGIAHWWNFRRDRGNYQGSNSHVDEVFRHLAIGIQGGRLGRDYGQGDSETLIERVRFESISIAAVDLGSFNALNWWIWDSQFTDCARGVSNEFSVDDHGPASGAGTFMVYRSVFRRSTVADISIGNAGWFSFDDNLSIGSRRFLEAASIGANAAPILLLRNTVVDAIEPVAVDVGNEGPLMLLDNRFIGAVGAPGPVVRMSGWAPGDHDILALGNRYTVAAPIAFAGTSGRVLGDDEQTIERDSNALAPPLVPDVPPARHRAVFEVARGADAREIQQAIDAAAASGAENALVHLPAGDYRVARTIVVPAGVRLQIAGDSRATRLCWSGADPRGTILRLAGPSAATLRDFSLFGRDATGIEIATADQPGGRVFVEASRLARVRTSGLASTRLDFQANYSIDGLDADGDASVLAIAGLGFGTVRVGGGSRVLESDAWYEGNRADLVHVTDGNFTFLGGELAPYSHGVGRGLDPDVPAILIEQSAGRTSIIGATLALRSAANGILVSGLHADAQAFFFGVTGTRPGFYRDLSGGAEAGLAFAKLQPPNAGTMDIPDDGRGDKSFVIAGFRDARSLIWETKPFDHTAGATDVRCFRIFTDDTAVGLHVLP